MRPKGEILFGVGAIIMTAANPMFLNTISPGVRLGAFIFGLLLVIDGTLRWTWGDTRTLLRLPGWALSKMSKPKPSASPQGRSYEDVVAVEQTKALFKKSGLTASHRLQSLFQDVRNNDALKGVTFLAGVDRERVRLAQSTNELRDWVTRAESATVNEIRSALLAFHQAYTTNVENLHQCEREGVKLTEKPHLIAYGDWEAIDTQYRDALRTAIELSSMGPIKRQIEEIGIRPATEFQFGALVGLSRKVMKDATPAEKHFLALFCESSWPDRLARQEGILLGAIYDAGHVLATKRFLVEEKLGGNVTRFTISGPAYYGWTMYEDGPNPTQQQIDIPLEAVMGSGASGSGA